MKRVLAASFALALALALPATAEPPDGTGAAPSSTAAMAPAPAEADRPLDPAMAAELERLEGDEARGGRAPQPAADEPSFLGQFFYTMLMLGGVVMAAYLILGKALPALMGMSAQGRRSMMAAPSKGVVEVIDRLALDPRRALLVVRVSGSYFLLSLSEQGVGLVARLDDAGLEGLRGTVAPGSFLGRLQELMRPKADKEAPA